jgi:hypothetical protein
MTAAGGAAGALLLSVLPAGAAPAQESGEPAGPVPYAMAEDAQPVEGALSTADAPRVEAGGFYTDELEPGEELYYSVVLDAVSDYYLSAVAAPESGAKVAPFDGINLRLLTTGGDNCGSAQERTFQSAMSARPIAAADVRTVDPDGDGKCQSADTYLLRLSRNSDPTSSPAGWPVELRVMAEPAATGGDLTAPPEAGRVDPDNPPAPPTGEAKPVRGGSGFNDAQPVDAGVWRDSIAPGATLFYRVPVDWHQQLVATVELSNATGVTSPGHVFDGFTVEAYTPFRALAQKPASTSYEGEPKKQQLVTPPVAYEHRTSADDRYAERARVSGWQYLAVHLHTDAGDITGDAAVPVTLRISLEGTVSAGPEYDGDLAAAGFGVTEQQRDQARKGKGDDAVAGEKQDSKQLTGYAGIGAGVTLLLILALWHLTARRRATRA